MKRILVLAGNGANHHIRMSLVNAWRAIGHEVFYWQSEGKSAFDVFEEFKPDIFLGSVWQLSRALVKNLIKYKPKVILYADALQDITDRLDPSKYPVGYTTEEQRRYIDDLINNCVSFELISNHGSKAVEFTHKGWSDYYGTDCAVHSVLVSADVTTFYPREADDRYKVQAFFCGGYWPYKSVNLDKYITPLLYPNTSWRIRIAGNGWTTVNSIGAISDEETSKHYTNASIIPHVVEPHCSDVFQDLPLRYFQTAACQGFAISCPVKDIRDVFDESELVVAASPEDFFEKAVHYLNNPEESEDFRWNAYRKIMTEHTGFHRVRQLFGIIEEDTSIIDEYIRRIDEGINQ